MLVGRRLEGDPGRLEVAKEVARVFQEEVLWGMVVPRDGGVPAVAASTGALVREVGEPVNGEGFVS